MKNTAKLDKAFAKYSRKYFLLERTKNSADIDAPIYIGYGQTNSQPTTVRNMLTWLDVKNGDNVLDVGSGSAWTTALLSYLVGKSGHVTAVEIVPELLEFGRHNCEKLKISNADFYLAQHQLGYPPNAPYQKILVSAGAKSIPQELLDQLTPSGTMVIPVGQNIEVITKQSNGSIRKKTHYGYAFVPLR